MCEGGLLYLKKLINKKGALYLPVALLLTLETELLLLETVLPILPLSFAARCYAKEELYHEALTFLRVRVEQIYCLPRARRGEALLRSGQSSPHRGVLNITASQRY